MKKKKIIKPLKAKSVKSWGLVYKKNNKLSPSTAAIYSAAKAWISAYKDTYSRIVRVEIREIATKRKRN